MWNRIRKFFRSEKGVAAVEYALIAGIVVAIAAGVFSAIGTDVNSIFQELKTAVNTAAN